MSDAAVRKQGDPNPATRRPCLRCRKPFVSTGPGNRLCRPCQQRAADMSPLTPN